MSFMGKQVVVLCTTKRQQVPHHVKYLRINMIKGLRKFPEISLSNFSCHKNKSLIQKGHSDRNPSVHH